MHVKHGMPLTPTFITKGRKGIEAKGPHLFCSRTPDGKWKIDGRLKGSRRSVKVLEKKRMAYQMARKLLNHLRDYGDDFVVNDGKRTWRVKAGDTLAFTDAQKGIERWFKRGGS
jgi:hypothetical protein